MSKGRIVIVEFEGLDADSEYGLVRTLRDLLERGAPTAVVVQAAGVAASAAAAAEPTELEPEPEPEIEPEAPRPAPRESVRTQEEIDEITIGTLRLTPGISMDGLAAAAYGSGDKNARRKLTWTLKRLATEGKVERLSATTWRAVDEPEELERMGDEQSDDDGYESNGHADDGELQELDI